MESRLTVVGLYFIFKIYHLFIFLRLIYEKKKKNEFFKITDFKINIRKFQIIRENERFIL
ncbi:hypothetical protein CMESO_423 (nucleomorph) [Chroomonas mesostigmatica CCMP1168]|uniref:Uncharacterized protein n=1 Tax=Chroomonas mesostigmatica CCMP1168 TaxID=1195612 RepID=J7GAU5_9CRYP|nr:hypothetical protein CMESO_423 [Chroomonas mesostigmatica CCMP1168]